MNIPPLVTIGVPLFNEGRFLEKSLEALISQDYAPIEIIISDNASTDETASICEQFSHQHDNIEYHRFDQNCGAAANFNYVLKQANGQYFMWASGHDLWSQNYISACVESLEKNPTAILAIGSGQWIDETGGVFPRSSGWTDTRGMDVIARYFTVLWGNMHPILGLIRRQALQACPMISAVGADLIILSRLALIGDFIHVVNATWSRREFRQEISYQDKLKRYKSNAYGLSTTFLKRLFPLAVLPWELIRAIVESKHKPWVKVVIVLLLLPTFPIRYVAGKVKPK